ncbi:MAG: TIGR03915 family putative DNA repair protein [Oscillospiraceae bacterium]|jgi:probable DNA metabolism protein|nr:TIGR03915 family putative DNA repair protein [Oscillospiraceae bacterium]
MTLLYYPPTWEGFLTAVFTVFDRKRKGVTLSVRHPRGRDGVSLFPSETVETDPEKARRVEAGMGRLSPTLSETVYTAWLSEHPAVEDDLIALLDAGFAANRDPRGNLTDPVTARVQKAAKDAGWEAHRMLQFIRFVRTPEGIYVADIEPKCNVLTLIGNHFHGRFNDQRLLIRDLTRRLVLVSRQEGWFIRELSPGEELPPLPDDGEFEDLWRGYFKAIANPARQNLKLQQQFVPLRYRKHLTEFQEIPSPSGGPGSTSAR